jgi:hypothetical protein
MELILLHTVAEDLNENKIKYAIDPVLKILLGISLAWVTCGLLGR